MLGLVMEENTNKPKSRYPIKMAPKYPTLFEAFITKPRNVVFLILLLAFIIRCTYLGYGPYKFIIFGIVTITYFVYGKIIIDKAKAKWYGSEN